MDVVLTGFLPPPTLTHSPPLLAELARLLRPSGLLLLREPVATSGETAGAEHQTLTSLVAGHRFGGGCSFSQETDVRAEAIRLRGSVRGIYACSNVTPSLSLSHTHTQSSECSYVLQAEVGEDPGLKANLQEQGVSITDQDAVSLAFVSVVYWAIGTAPMDLVNFIICF